MYAPESFDDPNTEWDRMPPNVAELEEAVVGHKIVSVSPTSDTGDRWYSSGLEITLDNGRRVIMCNTDDCCAYTELNSFLLNVDKIDHIISGVGTTEGFSTWHIYADMGDVLELDVSWSGSNGYYAYGFYIKVVDPE